MIDAKKMKEIEELSKDAVRIMDALHTMEKRNMKWDVEGIVFSMQEYDDICKKIRKLANED